MPRIKAVQKIGYSITMKDKIVNFTYITSILMLLAVVFGVLLVVASTGLAVPLESIAAELSRILANLPSDAELDSRAASATGKHVGGDLGNVYVTQMVEASDAEEEPEEEPSTGKEAAAAGASIAFGARVPIVRGRK